MLEDAATEEEKAKLRDALLSHGQRVPDCLMPAHESEPRNGHNESLD